MVAAQTVPVSAHLIGAPEGGRVLVLNLKQQECGRTDEDFTSEPAEHFWGSAKPE